MTDTKLTNLEQAAKVAAKEAFKQSYGDNWEGAYNEQSFEVEVLVNLFLAGASHASQSVPGNIVERLERENPYPGESEVMPWDTSAWGAWNHCCAKLRELLSQSVPDDDIELEDKITNILCESIEEDSDHSLRGTDIAVKKIIKLFSERNQSPESLPAEQGKEEVDYEPWDELWDEASEHIDDDLDSLAMVAGSSVIRKQAFDKIQQHYKISRK